MKNKIIAGLITVLMIIILVLVVLLVKTRRDKEPSKQDSPVVSASNPQEDTDIQDVPDSAVIPDTPIDKKDSENVDTPVYPDSENEMFTYRYDAFMYMDLTKPVDASISSKDTSLQTCIFMVQNLINHFMTDENKYLYHLSIDDSTVSNDDIVSCCSKAFKIFWSYWDLIDDSCKRSFEKSFISPYEDAKWRIFWNEILVDNNKNERELSFVEGKCEITDAFISDVFMDDFVTYFNSYDVVININGTEVRICFKYIDDVLKIYQIDRNSRKYFDDLL